MPSRWKMQKMSNHPDGGASTMPGRMSPNEDRYSQKYYLSRRTPWSLSAAWPHVRTSMPTPTHVWDLTAQPRFRHAWSMAKYDPVAQLLRQQHTQTVTLDFEQIARLIDGGLPPSAYRYQAWWANGADGRHVQSVAWITEGWVVDHVALASRRVTFHRARAG